MPTRPDTLESRETLLRQALAIMESDYAEPLDVDGVARRVLTSRRQLQRVFSELHATSFRTTLREVRMEQATRLLATDVPIGEVAKRVGYTEAPQFAKAFRRTFGMTPTEYRATRTVPQRG